MSNDINRLHHVGNGLISSGSFRRSHAQKQLGEGCFEPANYELSHEGVRITVQQLDSAEHDGTAHRSSPREYLRSACLCHAVLEGIGLLGDVQHVLAMQVLSRPTQSDAVRAVEVTYTAKTVVSA